DSPAPVQDSVGGEPTGRPVGHAGTRVEVSERPAWSLGGGGAVGAVVLALVVVAAGAIGAAASEPSAMVGLTAAGLLLALLVLTGISVISPGETLVVQLFGRYLGTVRRTGLIMTVPLTSKRRVSVRVRNFETSEL